MANCRNLELLRISANQFKELPGFLLELPKLSWLAFAGNPFSHIPLDIEKLNLLDWNEFEIREKLGEGASGDIYKALWKNENKEVAIKVFKGEVTSDGFPEDELQAAIVAGVHPHLVTLLGEIKNHPEQKQGLVMALIPESFYNLGLPPSLETCSRDTFAAGTTFSLNQILKIITSVASATKHLHEHGILHGDLYAHNTLIERNANTLIGDFGAASFFRNSDPHALALQRIESRALGCLLDDLLMHVSLKETRTLFFDALELLRDNLMSENPVSRWLVSEASDELNLYKLNR